METTLNAIYKAAGRYWVGFTGVICKRCGQTANVRADKDGWKCLNCHAYWFIFGADSRDNWVVNELHSKPQQGPTAIEYTNWLEQTPEAKNYYRSRKILPLSGQPALATFTTDT